MTTEQAPYAVIQLSAEIDGRQVEWAPWETPPHPTHVPLDCDTCDWQDGPRAAWGFVMVPPRRRSWGPQRLSMFHAFRCPRCQDTRVYRIGGEFTEVLRIPPTPATHPGPCRCRCGATTTRERTDR